MKVSREEGLEIIEGDEKRRVIDINAKMCRLMGLYIYVYINIDLRLKLNRNTHADADLECGEPRHLVLRGSGGF